MCRGETSRKYKTPSQKCLDEQLRVAMGLSKPMRVISKCGGS